jgi:hypothetical protein
MALLYLSVGIFLGGVSAFLAMAMFFLAKETDDMEDELVTSLGSVAARQDIH